MAAKGSDLKMVVTRSRGCVVVVLIIFCMNLWILPCQCRRSTTTGTSTSPLSCLSVFSWKDLKRHVRRVSSVNETVATATLCPFSILKPTQSYLQLSFAVPPTQSKRVTKSITVQCAVAGKCVLEGKGTHIIIADAKDSSLATRRRRDDNSITIIRIDGFVFGNATTSAIQVVPSSTTTTTSSSSPVSLFLQKCTFRFNRIKSKTGDGRGGAALRIHSLVRHTQVTIKSCHFRHNNVRIGTSGGSNDVGGGNVILHQGMERLVIRDSSFESNTVGGTQGTSSSSSSSSVIYIEGSTTPSTIVQTWAELASTTFTDNTLSNPTLLGASSSGFDFDVDSNSDSIISDSSSSSSSVLSIANVGDVVIREGVVGYGNAYGCNGMFVRNKQQQNNSCFEFHQIPFVLGNLTLLEHGFVLSQGLTIQLLAKMGQPVALTSPLATTNRSTLSFHVEPDGAAMFESTTTAASNTMTSTSTSTATSATTTTMVYVSNSEASVRGTGGVYSLTLDANGNTVDYQQLLSNTTRNCNGGITPWQTFVSCEEVPKGQCWQVDPFFPSSSSSFTSSSTSIVRQRPAQKTVLGEAEGGLFEAVAVDSRDLKNLRFFVTEDAIDGAVRRFTPAPQVPFGWDMLHVNTNSTNGASTMEYLEFLSPPRTPTPPGNNDWMFRWTTNKTVGRLAATQYFQFVEGIAFHNGKLSFISKTQRQLFELDLDSHIYTVTNTTTTLTSGALPGGGKFDGTPDQIVVNTDGYDYFTEEGGKHPGIFALSRSGTTTTTFRALLEANDDMYQGFETTGIEFATNQMFMLFCVQEVGMLFQVRRLDGLPFEGRRVLKWKYGLGR